MPTSFSGRRYYATSVVISLIASLLISIHALVPSYQIDTTTVALFLLLLAPWLFPFVSKISLPGGGGIETRDIEDFERISERVSIKPQAVGGPKRKQIPSLGEAKLLPGVLLDQDPNLALAGIRMNVERLVRLIAKEVPDISQYANVRSLRDMTQLLYSREVLSAELVEAINSIIRICNRAIHQLDVDRETAERVVIASGPVVDALEQTLSRLRLRHKR